MKAKKCQAFKQNEASWAKQYIASDEPTYSAIGWHYRGFRIVAMCDDCKERGERKS